METKHTPGPWTVHKMMLDCVTFDGPEGMENLFLCNVDGYYACQNEADARLIAAAPDLLEALRWYVENDDTNIGMEGNEFWEEGLERGKAALAKATGEQA